jgi:hypothetical protein
MPASNPYNPYFGPGLMPIQIGPEHAATALASNSMPQAMSIATNAGTQPQKRNDRVQVKPLMPLVVVVIRVIYAGLCCEGFESTSRPENCLNLFLFRTQWVASGEKR